MDLVRSEAVQYRAGSLLGAKQPQAGTDIPSPDMRVPRDHEVARQGRRRVGGGALGVRKPGPATQELHLTQTGLGTREDCALFTVKITPGVCRIRYGSGR